MPEQHQNETKLTALKINVVKAITTSPYYVKTNPINTETYKAIVLITTFLYVSALGLYTG